MTNPNTIRKIVFFQLLTIPIIELLGVRYLEYLNQGVCILLMLSYIGNDIKLVERKTIQNRIILFTVMITLYVIATPTRFIGIIEDIYSLIRIFFWVIGFFYISKMTINRRIDKHDILKFGHFMIIIFSLITVYHVFVNPVYEGNKDYTIVDTGYQILFFLPYLFLSKLSYKSLFYHLLIISTVVLALKRGPALILLVSYSFLLVYSLYSSNLTRSTKITASIFFALLFAFSYVIYNSYSDYIDEIFNARTSDLFSEDVGKFGSGRGTIYTLIVDNWAQSHFINMMIGHGYKSVSVFLDSSFGSGLYAHSDWLQILHDFGLIGIVVFISLHFAILKTIRIYYLNKSDLFLPLIFFYIIFMMKGIYSGTYMFPTLINLAIILGYVINVKAKKINSNI